VSSDSPTIRIASVSESLAIRSQIGLASLQYWQAPDEMSSNTDPSSLSVRTKKTTPSTNRERGFFIESGEDGILHGLIQDPR